MPPRNRDKSPTKYSSPSDDNSHTRAAQKAHSTETRTPPSPPSPPAMASTSCAVSPPPPDSPAVSHPLPHLNTQKSTCSAPGSPSQISESALFPPGSPPLPGSSSL